MKKILILSGLFVFLGIGSFVLVNSQKRGDGKEIKQVNKEIKQVEVNPVASLTPEEILTRGEEFEGKEVELKGITHLAGLGRSDKFDGLSILETAFTVPGGAVAVSGGDFSQLGGKELKARGIFTIRSNDSKYKIGQLTIPEGCQNCIEMVEE